MKKLPIRIWAVALAFAGFASSCNNDDEDNALPTLNIPDTYVSTSYSTNAATELAVRDEHTALVGEMKGADGGNSVSESDLVTAWNGTTLKTVTVSSYASMIDAWLPELAKAAGNTFDPFADDRGEGGFYGSHTFDENGLEPEQMVDKGLYMSAHYNHALTVLNGTVDAAAVDKLVAIFGASPLFPNNDSDANFPDDFSAKYTERRTTTSSGLYLDIRNNLIAAKAAIEAGSAFNTERDAALNAFKENWEKAIMATTVYYLNGAREQITTGLSQSGDEQANSFGDALHSLAEAVGFSYGLYSVNDRIATDAQLESILALMEYPLNDTPEPYKMITEPGTTDSGNLANLGKAIEEIKSIYGFTDAEITGFFVNN